MNTMKLAFHTESRFWRVMDRLGDLVRLNLLFLLTSLPVVTIGASLTAMYAVLFKMQEKRDGGLAADYRAAFKENFKNSTVIWIFYLLFVGVCALNFFIELPNRQLLFVLLGVVFALLTMTVFYSFAMLARFENSLIDTLAKAFVIGAMGLPYTVVMALMAAALVILTIQSYLSILVMASFWLLFGFALVAYVDAVFYLRVFRRFTAKEDLPGDGYGETRDE